MSTLGGGDSERGVSGGGDSGGGELGGGDSGGGEPGVGDSVAALSNSNPVSSNSATEEGGTHITL